MKVTVVKRTKPRPARDANRRGWTNADGTRMADAPPNWPFGTVPVQPPRVSAARPRNRRSL